MRKLLSHKTTWPILIAFVLGLCSPNFAAAQDTDGDGLPDAVDCKPLNPALGRMTIWTDVDGDWAFTCRTGCFSIVLPPPILGRVYVYAYNPGQMCDCDDSDPYGTCRPEASPGPNGLLPTYDCPCFQDPDTDNDGESDFTDCAPNNSMVYHGAPEICDGIDNDCDGVIDEGCTSGCNGDPQKVTICHNNHTICIAPSAVAAHQAHGDQTGQCPNSMIHSVELADEQNLKAGFIISPNPARGRFTVTLDPLEENSERLVRVLTHNGQLIQEIKVRQQTKFNLNIDKAGTYLVQVITGKQITTKKLVVLR